MHRRIVNYDQIRAVVLERFGFHEFVEWLIIRAQKEIPSREEFCEEVECGYVFVNNEIFYDEITRIFDWVVGLKERNESDFGKLSKMTWQHVLRKSDDWHEKLLKRSIGKGKYPITYNEECPVVMEFDDGDRWVWLKTSTSRYEEGEVMGHCVGKGGYEKMGSNEGIFSLRDKSGYPLVTSHLKGFEIIQAKGFANRCMDVKYRVKLDLLKNKMGSKFFVKKSFICSDLNQGVYDREKGVDDDFYLKNDNDMVKKVEVSGGVVKKIIFYDDRFVKMNENEENRSEFA